MSVGAGFSAAGFSPAGWGDLDTAPAPAKDLLLDDKGIQQSARAIDARTGQYILNPSGRPQGMPRVRQLVLLRVKTVLNSAAVQNIGLARMSGDRTANAPKTLETNLRNALDDLVKAKLVNIVSVASTNDISTRILGYLKWQDLTTGQEFQEPL